MLLAGAVAVVTAPFAAWGHDGREPELAVAVVVIPTANEIDPLALGDALAAAAEPSSAVAPAAVEVPPAPPEPAAPAAPPAPVAPVDAAAAPRPPTVAPAAAAASKGEQALALITYPWQTLGYEIVFLPPQAGLRARTLRIERRIEVYVRPKDSVRTVAFDIAHEIGHAVDFTVLDPDDRGLWQQARGIDSATPWWGCSACTDYATPAGDWAESFAAWQVGGDFRSEMAPPPTPDQLTILARLAS